MKCRCGTSAAYICRRCRALICAWCVNLETVDGFVQTVCRDPDQCAGTSADHPQSIVAAGKGAP